MTSVEVRGFEPLTPCMPCKCSAELSYTPERAELYQSLDRWLEGEAGRVCP